LVEDSLINLWTDRLVDNFTGYCCSEQHKIALNEKDGRESRGVEHVLFHLPISPGLIPVRQIWEAVDTNVGKLKQSRWDNPDVK